MPRQGAGTVVFNTDRTQVVLQLREDIRAWGLPAGGFEPGEAPEQTAIREAREETGYEIEIIRKVGEYWRPQMPNGGVLFHVYEARAVGGDPSKHDWESLAVEWFPVNKLPQPMAPFAKQIVEDAVKDVGTQANQNKPVKRTQMLSASSQVLLRAFLAVRRMQRGKLRRFLLDALHWLDLVLRINH
jgi:8-oxo-dGTP pyrophosphatase MutT (NUDIX family)